MLDQDQVPDAARQQQIAEYGRCAEEAYAADARGEPPPYQTLDALGQELIAEWCEAYTQRQQTEARWLRDLRQYKGIYEPEELERIGPKRSKTFVKKTQVKIRTVDARMSDLIFPASSDRNWTIDATPDPSIPDEMRQRIVEALTQAKQPPQAPGQPPLQAAPPTEGEIQEAIRKACAEAAKAMQTVIDDQLTEARYKQVCRQVMHSCHLFGTGILKGPLVERKVRIRHVATNGKWEQKAETYTLPFVDFVPLWRFYPDMAATTLDECRYTYERHLMTRMALLKLAERPSFKKYRRQIIDYVQTNPKGAVTRFDAGENDLKAIGNRLSVNQREAGQYEVLERWGWLTGDQLKAAGVKVPANRLYETFFSNVWLLPSGQIIKAAIQPINGVTWPYHLYYFQKDETNIFAEGLAALMRDDQTMLNAAIRMILDHAAVTAGPQIEVNTDLVTPSQDVTDQFPFKIWLRNGKDPGVPAVRVIQLPSEIQHLQTIAAIFETAADETTAIPRYMYGENATQGAAGTSSGMSMLMGAASIVLKDLMTSFDEGVTRPFIESLYHWNMQFNPNPAIKGDFDVKARGAASLIAKELRAQQLDQFAATVANPMDGPLVKRDQLLRQRAEAHDLVDVIKTPEEVAADANNEIAQQQAQLAQKQAELNLQLLAGKVAETDAKVKEMAARAELLNQEAIERAVAAVYAAMQAAGVAVSNPGVAPAGDEILKSVGYQDRTPQQTTTETLSETSPDAAQPPHNPVPDRRGPGAGMHQGIETLQLG